MPVRTHTDIDWDAALIALIVILQAAVDDLQADVDVIDDEIEVVDGIVDAILVHTTAIEAVTSALPTLTETGTTVTTTVINTEYNIYVNAVPLGVFNPIGVNIDCREHTAGETIVIRYYEQIAAGVADPILVDELEYAGAMDDLIKVEFAMPNRFGIWVTIERTAGAARTYVGEPFYEI